ncbi:DMT family transporter [Nocardia yamanashiensis]|uniref:DMT family transporter n=1 Tax=Nocardia yamanashiensis TaxID=209247 RepID=UPI0008311E4D|nr:DMT family transporter [Nocardia yamanashiensis]
MTGYRSIGLLLAGTSLWGISSALIAAVARTGFTSAALVAAGGATAVLGVAVLRGDRPWRIFRDDWSLYLRLGVLEAVNLALYMAALRIGPLPMMVALHLSAPVLLIVARLATRRRSFSFAVAVELSLVAMAILLVSGRHPGTLSSTGVLLGCALSLSSAACVAALITVVAGASRGRGSVASAGLQLATAAVLGLPLLLIAPPEGPASLALIAIGAGFLGPGFVCYWWALRTVDAPTAGIVGLNEAVSASIVGAAVTGSQLTPAVLGAGALVLLAIGLEVRSTPNSDGPPRRTAHTTSDPYRR